MAERIAIEPIVLDVPSPRTIAVPKITGTGKIRRDHSPSQTLVVIGLGALLVCLAVSVAFAGQRLVEIDARYAAEERV